MADLPKIPIENVLDEILGGSKTISGMKDNITKNQTAVADKEILSKVTTPSNTIKLTDSAKAPVARLHIIGQSLQDGTPTPEDPKEIVSVGVRQEDGSFTVELRSCGKNLFNRGKLITGKVIDYENGYEKNTTNEQWCTDFIKVVPGGTYTKSNFSSGQENWQYDKYKKPIKAIQPTGYTSSFTVESNCEYIRLSGGNKDTAQLELGSSATTYEPYTGSESLLSLPEPLCGLKVDSGGNYTDESSQQWLTDEIVKYADGSGEIIKRTVFFKFTGESGWTLYKQNQDSTVFNVQHKYNIFNESNLYDGKYALSNMFEKISGSKNGFNISNYSVDIVISPKLEGGEAEEKLSQFKEFLNKNDLIVIGCLATPTTTPLTAAQVAELEKLYTFSPTTNITMGSAGVMDLDYYKNTSSGQAVGNVHANVARANLNVSEQAPIVYGFHINSQESNPSYAVTYLADAIGLTPAKMNYNTGRFDYGSWKDAFFMPRPCMLKSDGTVNYYLDPNDYGKKADGAASQVSDTSYDGNAMMEWGQNGNRIWYKVVPDADDDTSGSVYISNQNVDGKYHAWSFYNADGVLGEHFYTPIYNGSFIDNKLRSLSGQACMNGKDAQGEITAAELNNPEGKKMWYTEVLADIQLINFLLILMGKSLDTQTVFGQGYTTGATSATDFAQTGTMNDKGLFWGSSTAGTKDTKTGVKVFGMENWWGNQWRRYAGHINNKGRNMVKMTYGMQDGSTTKGYNATADGYIDTGEVPTGSAAYIKSMKFTEDGIYPSAVTGGSQSTYYCDGFWSNNGQLDYALRGGNAGNGSICGAFALDLNNAPSIAYWAYGSALSCKPLV